MFLLDLVFVKVLPQKVCYHYNYNNQEVTDQIPISYTLAAGNSVHYKYDS